MKAKKLIPLAPNFYEQITHNCNCSSIGSEIIFGGNWTHWEIGPVTSTHQSPMWLIFSNTSHTPNDVTSDPLSTSTLWTSICAFNCNLHPSLNIQTHTCTSMHTQGHRYKCIYTHTCTYTHTCIEQRTSYIEHYAAHNVRVEHDAKLI